MGILAADKRFLRMFRKELPDSIDRRIHLAFHITGGAISSVVENTFVMDKPVRVQSVKQSGHLKQIAAAIRFVSDRPDQDRSMVLVPLIAGSHSVQKDGQPLFFIPRQDVFLR